MASAYLSRTQTTPSGDENKKFTLSLWLKRSKLGSNGGLYGNTYSSVHRGFIYFDSDDKLIYYDSATPSTLTTNRRFRDTNGWYHIVFAVDTTQATAANRIKLYINGTQETSFSTETYPSQDQSLKLMNTTNTPNVGRYDNGSGTINYFDGLMSHVHFTQGYTYQASTFGETDSTTGQWKINTNPTVANYGTNGFFILKDGNSVTDQSGNSNNWTANGTLTNTEDNPSNVFATFNPLLGARTYNQVFSNGNLTVQGTTTGHEPHASTLAFSKGKYYFEAKLDAIGNFPQFGAVEAKNLTVGGTDINTMGYGWFFNGNIMKLGTQVATYSSYTTGDILSIALDADNGEIYFAKNGTWENSSDPVNRTNPAITGVLTDDIMFAVNNYASTWSANFGNGYFGTTAISSEGTNASGIGKFEYDVPTGYTALSTKGLNE